MNPLLIFVIMAYETQAHYVPESDSPHVGTVLFTPFDLGKRQWSKTNIALLQARKYFQNLIPPSHFINTINERHLTHLLTYFEDTYSTIKREIKNPSLQNMMEVALSDAVGGYLKIWVLPITKYAYYGGTIPLEKAVKTFEIYENIKRSLKTNGRGWRSPNENLLNSVAINVVSLPREHFRRSMGDSCESLAYYEKTDSGMTIPLPFISWNVLPTSMFVPLKNQSIVFLSSPNSSKILLKYYNIAENCMHDQKHKLDDFDERFQNWLSEDVAPHLDDEQLYIAFGGVLGLMNMTKKFYHKISRVCNKQYVKLKENASLRSPMTLHSKKFIIIAIILLIELFWCISTLLLIMRSRKRKKRKPLIVTQNNVSVSKCSPSSPSTNMKRTSILSNDSTEQNTKNERTRGVKLLVKPTTRNLEINVQCPSYDTKCVMSQQTSALMQKTDIFNEQITLIDEVPTKSSLKKIVPEFNVLSSTGVSREFNSLEPTDIVKKHGDSQRKKPSKVTKHLSSVSNKKKLSPCKFYTDTANNSHNEPMKSSLKKILPEFNVLSSPRVVESNRKESENFKSTDIVKKHGDSQSDEPSKAMTLIKNSEQDTVQELIYTRKHFLPMSNKEMLSPSKCGILTGNNSDNNNNAKPLGTDQTVTSTGKHLPPMSNEKIISPCEYNSTENNSHDDNNSNSLMADNICSCTKCLINEQMNNKKIIKKGICTELKSKLGNFRRKEKDTRTVPHSRVSEKKSQTKKQSNTVTNQAIITKKNDSKVSTNQPLLRIRVDRPEAEINVDITSHKEHSRTPKKPSKIPRLAVKTPKETVKAAEEEIHASKVPIRNLEIDNASYIIRTRGLIIKGKTVDDSIIKKESVIDEKLNVTL